MKPAEIRRNQAPLFILKVVAEAVVMNPKKQPKILVVDDSEQNAEAISAQLIAEGYEVDKAYDGESALKKVKDLKPDLILLDVLMPRLNGYEVCRRLKEYDETKFVPVILVTAFGESEDRIKGLEVGADDFLTKPLNPNEMLARIRSLLRMKDLIEKQRARDQYVAEFSKLLELGQIRREEETRRRQVYKDVIYAVTNGKLLLMEQEELVKYAQEGEEIYSLEIQDAEDVGKARNIVENISKKLRLQDERVYDLVVCVSEAVTNVIKHAKSGRIKIKKTTEKIQVWVDDYGPGIDFSQLPTFTLRKGFSTKPSLGYGFTILLELLDQLLLCTSSQGTTVVLEMLFELVRNSTDLDSFLTAWDKGEPW